MQKSDWYKLLAIGIVAAFVIEGVAIGVMQNQAPVEPVDQAGQAATDGKSFLGTLRTNLTIVRYEPYLIVTGGGTAAETAKQSLIDRGLATYSVPSPSGSGFILNLNGSKNAVAAAAELEAANATVLAQISYLMPPTVTVEGTGISVVADGAGFGAQARPVYEEGSKVPATMQVQVDKGKIIGIGNLNILPESVSGAVVEASLVGEARTAAQIEIPWEARLAAKPIVSEAGAVYKQKSYITVAANATKEQLDAAKLIPYVTGSQPGIVSVKTDFVNITKATEDFTLLRLSPEFPPSAATFANGSAGEKESALVAKLATAGIAAAKASSTSAKVKLPETIEKDGKTYYTGGQEIEIALVSGIGNATSVTVALDFEAAGNTISRIMSAKQVG